MEILEIMDSAPLYDKNGMVIKLHDRVRVDLWDGPQIGLVKAGNRTEVFVAVQERRVSPFIADKVEIVEEARPQETPEFRAIRTKFLQKLAEKDPNHPWLTKGQESYTVAQEIFVNALNERVEQDNEWGGAENDDRHTPTDWLRFIHKQEQKAKDLDSWPRRESATYEKRLIKIIALCIAAIESLKRLEKTG